MNHKSTLIVRIEVLRIRQSYAYDTKTHIFTSAFDAYADHTPRIMKKIHFRGLHVRLAHAYDSSAYDCCVRRIHKRMISVRMEGHQTFRIAFRTLIIRIGFQQVRQSYP